MKTYLYVLVLGFALGMSGLILDGFVQRVPLEIDFDPNKKVIETPIFSVTHSAYYEIRVSILNDGSKEANCILKPIGLNNCGNISSVVYMKWEILKDGRVVDSGSSNKNSSRSTLTRRVYRTIGEVLMEKSDNYVIKIYNFNDTSLLNNYDPKLTVSMLQGQLHEYGYVSAGFLVLSILLIFFSLFMIALSAVLKIMDRVKS